MTESGHTLQIENRNRICMTGINEVESFSESKVVAIIGGKDKVIIIGDKLKISVFQKENGNLRLDGEIRQVTYSAGKLSAVGKIFK